MNSSDRASNAWREPTAAIGAEAVIVCNPTRKKPVPSDFDAYRAHGAVERCFKKL